MPDSDNKNNKNKNEDLFVCENFFTNLTVVPIKIILIL